jgi:hypothetical protein
MRRTLHQLALSRPDAARLRVPLLWTAYIVLPAAGWGVFHGAPVGAAGLVALGAIWWIWTFGGPLPGRTMWILILLKLLAGPFLLVDRGMRADYFADARWTPPAEQSIDYPGRRFTRIDRRLAYGDQGEPDLPLYFFNDSSRFNFYQASEPDRRTLPFSARWQGYVLVRTAQPGRMLYASGQDVAAEIWVDGSRSVVLEPSAGEALGQARWPAGWRHLVVRLTSTSGGHRFEAGMIGADETRTPFSDAEIVGRSFAPSRMAVDRIVRAFSGAIDAVLIAILAVGTAMTLAGAARRFGDARALVALGWFASAVLAVLFARPAANHLILFEGGSNYLVQESRARDIALHGPLMLLGGPRGEAQPFDDQPLYPYFLALVHLLAGEDLFGVFVVQWLLAFGVVQMAGMIGAALFGEIAGRATLVLGGIYFVAKLAPLSHQLVSENLFIPLVTAWTLLLIRMSAPASSERTAAGTGFIAGLATLARSTLLIGWVFVLPVLAGAVRRGVMAARPVAVMFVTAGAVMSMAVVRNVIASHRIAPVTMSSGVNVFIVNQPPVTMARSDDDPGTAGQVAGSASGPFARRVAARALYGLGDFDRLVPGAGGASGLILTWCAALIGAGLVLRGHAPDGLHGPVRALPAVLSLSHFAVVVLLVPHLDGDRLMLPFYVLLLPYAALGTMRAIDFLVPPEDDGGTR